MKSMLDYRQAAEDYERIEQAIRYLEEQHQRQPSLQEVAESVHLSEYHFQRLFTRWVGISPKRFLQFLTKENAKHLLAGSASLLETAYETGLSSAGRLHDLFVNCEAVTPGEFKFKGQGLDIWYGFHPTPFGECLLALTERGICKLAFVTESGRDAVRRALVREWEQAEVREEPERTEAIVRRIFERPERSGQPLPLILHGTNFQIKVWEALLRIPSGRLVSYQDVAKAIGHPGAVRAVGTAIGKNPVPVIIPCHRVIRASGEFGEYGYGTPRKLALLGWEMAQAANNA